eukprot:355984-Chlamydomonas_euryale.AAC.6
MVGSPAWHAKAGLLHDVCQCTLASIARLQHDVCPIRLWAGWGTGNVGPAPGVSERAVQGMFEASLTVRSLSCDRKRICAPPRRRAVRSGVDPKSCCQLQSQK